MVYPHEFFRRDFDNIIEEARRQERIDANIIGELSVAQEMHAFFVNDVLPLILNDDFVYEAAEKFATQYAMDCFRHYRLGGREVSRIQRQNVAIKDRVTNIWALAAVSGYASKDNMADLVKMSDFIKELSLDNMSPTSKRLILELAEDARDHEDLQVHVVSRAIADCYEKIFTRIMFVVRRAMKVRLKNRSIRGESHLLKPIDYIEWLSGHTADSHVLNQVFVKDREIYRRVRNVANHQQALEWVPDQNAVLLWNEKMDSCVEVDVDKFHQLYRYLATYFCEFGLRGILSVYCERERT